MKGFVTCDRHNCVHCRKGLNGEMVCQALYDNDEYKEYCPFFKSKEEAEKQRKKLLGVKVKNETLKIDYKELYNRLHPDTANKSHVFANGVSKKEWWQEVIENQRNKLEYKDKLIVMMVEDKYDSMAHIDELSAQINNYNKSEAVLFKVKSELQQEVSELKSIIDAFVAKYGFDGILEDK